MPFTAANRSSSHAEGGRAAVLVALLALLAAVVALLPGPAQAAATTLTAQWSDGSVEYGDRVSAKGTVSPAVGGRTLELQRHNGDEWVTVVTGTAPSSASASAYSLSFTATSLGTVGYRVVALAGGGDGDQATSATFELTTSPRTRTVAASLSDSRVRVGAKVTLSGVVRNGTGPATVRLVRQLPGPDQGLATKRTTGAGRFAFRVPSSWINTHRLAVVALPTAANRQATKVVSLRVVPAYRPAGRSSMWNLPGGDDVIKFDPCDVITYRVNVAKAPAKGLRTVKQSMRRIAQATGLRFRYLGTSTAVPTRTQPTDTDLMIGWANDRQVPQLGGSVAGVGGFQIRDFATEASGKEVFEIAFGFVALDVRPKLAGGFGTGPRYGWQGTVGQLLLHEVGHALGLDHVNNRSQIMYPALTRKLARYGAGDFAGLRRLGRAYGCLTSAQPREQPRAAAGRGPDLTPFTGGRWLTD